MDPVWRASMSTVCVLVSVNALLCLAEEHVHVCVRLLRQHRRLSLHPHHPTLPSHHHEEGHSRPQQVSASFAIF